MNSETSKTSKPYVLIMNLTDKIDLQKREKSIALSSLSTYYTWKNMKNSYNKNNLKYQLQHGMINLNYQMDHILYKIFKIILSISKRHGEDTDNPSTRIYVIKMKNRITFIIETGHYIELLTNETMKLLGSTESKITKDKNGQNVRHLEVTEVVLQHF